MGFSTVFVAILLLSQGAFGYPAFFFGERATKCTAEFFMPAWFFLIFLTTTTLRSRRKNQHYVSCSELRIEYR